VHLDIFLVVYNKVVINLLHGMSGLIVKRFIYCLWMYCSCRKWECKLFTMRENWGHCLFLLRVCLCLSR